MKALIVTLLVFSSSAFAAKTKLFSADTCMRAHIACPQVVGVKFVTDDLGRCGCVRTRDVIKPRTCRVAFIVCNEAEGEIFTSLTSGGKNIGCGCFATEGE